MDFLKGKVSSKELSSPIPFFSPPYEAPTGTMEWSGVSSIIIRYRTDGELIRHLLPDNLAIERNPIVTLMIVDYGPAPLGACFEVFQMVEVLFNGKKFNFSILLVLDNPRAVYIGRELFGFPKILGEVDFKPLLADETAEVRGHCISPLDDTSPALEYSFKPTTRLSSEVASQFGAGGAPVLNLRLIPSSVPRAKPSVREFVEVDFHLEVGEVWEGDCEFKFPSTAESEPFHQLPVVERLSSHLVRKCTSFVTLGEHAFTF